MVKRLVKLTFAASDAAFFEEVFTNSKDKIRAFPGCNHVELLADVNTPGVYFTFSLWDDPSDLENYRHSELFKSTWAVVKPRFTDKPMAWTTKLMGQGLVPTL